MTDQLTTVLTHRGFAFAEWDDRYGHRCSVQKSSLATEDCIWLGVDDAAPQLMASDAKRLGYPTNGKTTGWVPFDVPKEVHMTTRMHLTREMVQSLIPLLNHFVNTGELPDAGTVFSVLREDVTNRRNNDD